jgi:glutamine cyclotransferase
MRTQRDGMTALDRRQGRLGLRLVHGLSGLCMVILILAGVTARSSGGGPSRSEQETTPVCGFTIIDEYPHDSEAFTQGLVFADGELYEGTGLWGRSSLRRVDLESGAVLQSLSLPSRFFGEGITVYGDKIIQLTWQSRVGFVYDRESFQLVEQFIYDTQGWGLTYDGQHLIMSDGTAILRFVHPQTFEEVRQLAAYGQDGPVTRLNELEYIHGQIYANVWQTDRVARIDPISGEVRSWIDLKGLLSLEDRDQPADVLNGIAYDAAEDRLLVTGKLWPKLFHIEVVCLEAVSLFLPLISGDAAVGIVHHWPPYP